MRWDGNGYRLEPEGDPDGPGSDTMGAVQMMNADEKRGIKRVAFVDGAVVGACAVLAIGAIAYLVLVR